MRKTSLPLKGEVPRRRRGDGVEGNPTTPAHRYSSVCCLEILRLPSTPSPRCAGTRFWRFAPKRRTFPFSGEDFAVAPADAFGYRLPRCNMNGKLRGGGTMAERTGVYPGTF